MPQSNTTSDTTTTRLLDLISSAFNLLSISSTAKDQEKSKDSDKVITAEKYHGYIASVHRMQDHVHKVFPGLGFDQEECSSLLQMLDTVRFDLQRQVLDMSEQDLDEQLVNGERLRKRLETTYVKIARKSGTTINDLIMKVKAMVMTAGYNYIMKDGEIKLVKMSTPNRKLRLEEEEFMTVAADDDVGLSTTEVTTSTTSSSGDAMLTTAPGPAYQSLTSPAQPIAIAGRPESVHRRFVRRYNAGSSSTLDTEGTGITDGESNTSGRLAENRLVGLAPAMHLAEDERWLAKPEIIQAQQHFQISTASLDQLELPSESNPEPLAASIAPNEGNTKTRGVLGSRPITGEVRPAVGDQKSQQSAEQYSSQEARQSSEVATETHLTHTRRKEYHARDADWVRRAPLPIIPWSGKTPDGGSAASLTSGGTPSTDGKIYIRR